MYLNFGSDSDGENDSKNEREYFLGSRSKKTKEKMSNFFYTPTKDPLIETNVEEAARLNAESKSCEQFKLTELDSNELANCERLTAEMQQKLKELSQQQTELKKKQTKHRYSEDKELVDLLNAKINTGYPNPRHEITCNIDKVEKRVSVTIKNCEDKEKIKKIFQPLLKSEPDITCTGKAESIENHLRVNVAFRLRDRDNLVNGLKLSNAVYNIPEARKYFQGC